MKTSNPFQKNARFVLGIIFTVLEGFLSASVYMTLYLLILLAVSLLFIPDMWLSFRIVKKYGTAKTLVLHLDFDYGLKRCKQFLGNVKA